MVETHKRNELVSFDNIDYENHNDLRKAQDALVREQFVRVQALKKVRHALEKCYRHHGVNHFEDCRELAELYMRMTDTHAVVKGFYGYQKNDPSQ